MQGMSERQYARHAGVSRRSVQKAKLAGRLILHNDGSIDRDASDVRQASPTDPSKSRSASRQRVKAVSGAAISAVTDTLREQAIDGADEGATYLEAKTANEILKAQERRQWIQQMKAKLINRGQAAALVSDLAREARGSWQTWPSRVAATKAADLAVDAATMQDSLESHVRAHLAELSDIQPGFR